MSIRDQLGIQSGIPKDFQGSITGTDDCFPEAASLDFGMRYRDYSGDRSLGFLEISRD